MGKSEEKSKKALNSLQQWIKNLVSTEVRKVKDMSFSVSHTVLGNKITSGLRQVTKAKTKSGPIVFYKSVNSNLNSTDQKVMFGVSNEFTGTDISIGEEGYSYSKFYNGLFGEMYADVSVGFDLTLSCEFGWTKEWDYTEMEYYSSVSISGDTMRTIMMGALCYSALPESVLVKVPAMSGAF